MDLDGTYGGSISPAVKITLAAGKTAVDLGSKYIILDGAADLTTLSLMTK